MELTGKENSCVLSNIDLPSDGVSKGSLGNPRSRKQRSRKTEPKIERAVPAEPSVM